MAASGLRIAEVLGLKIKDVSDNGMTLTLRQQAYCSIIVDRLKTKNAARQIDLHPTVGAELVTFIGDRKLGLLFETRNGRPHSQANLLQRNLYSALEAVGIEQCGFHPFRRFRTTHLRKQRTSESLIKFWLGHGEKSVTDGYDRTRENRWGLDFRFPLKFS